MRHPIDTRTQALEMLETGLSRTQIIEKLGLKKSTLATWILRERSGHPQWMPAVRKDAHPPLKGFKVSHVRSVLSKLAEGSPVALIARETGHCRNTIRRWRDQPKYREATLEYDPAFDYDHNDLLDRAVVAHHLCADTQDVGERLDLLMAVIGETDTDEFSVPKKAHTRRKARR